MEQLPLHNQLVNILGPFEDGESHCYFEPPSDIQLKYPCIIYHKEGDRDDFADNIQYIQYKRYTIIVIDEDPDSQIPDRLKNALMYCSSSRNYCSDGLWHFPYTLYFDGPRIEENIEIEEEEDNG